MQNAWTPLSEDRARRLGVDFAGLEPLNLLQIVDGLEVALLGPVGDDGFRHAGRHLERAAKARARHPPHDSATAFVPLDIVVRFAMRDRTVLDRDTLG